MTDKKGKRQLIRFLKIIAMDPDGGVECEFDGDILSISHSNRCHQFQRRTWQNAIANGLTEHDGSNFRILPIGISTLHKMLHPDEEHVNPGINLSKSELKSDGEFHPVIRNLSESPLSRLFLRKTKNGDRYLSQDEFLAGEKLRADFEKGNLQPNISANWSS